MVVRNAMFLQLFHLMTSSAPYRR